MADSVVRYCDMAWESQLSERVMAPTTCAPAPVRVSRTLVTSSLRAPGRVSTTTDLPASDWPRRAVASSLRPAASAPAWALSSAACSDAAWDCSPGPIAELMRACRGPAPSTMPTARATKMPITDTTW